MRNAAVANSSVSCGLLCYFSFTNSKMRIRFQFKKKMIYIRIVAIVVDVGVHVWTKTIVANNYWHPFIVNNMLKHGNNNASRLLINSLIGPCGIQCGKLCGYTIVFSQKHCLHTNETQILWRSIFATLKTMIRWIRPICATILVLINYYLDFLFYSSFN